tara:strand:- start:3386 stop:4861 length:1476 start_codon:yes stop_codon:yes gene_type:complete
MFSNLANMFSDVNFWGGVAEGASTEFLRQEDRKEKDVRELRNFIISESSSIDAENRKELSAAEEAAEQLGALIKGSRNANSAAVKEATMFLIDQHGSAAAALEAAKSLNEQYSTYGEPFDPIRTLGFTDDQLDDRVAPTYAQIGRTYASIRPLPTLSSVQLESINDKTALDKIFGGKGVAELAIETAQPLIGDTITSQTQDAFETLEPEKPYYSEYVIGSNFKQELKRMYAAQTALQSIPEAQRDSDFDSKTSLINERISILKKVETMSDPDKDLTESTRKSLTQYFAGLAQYGAGYATEFSPYGYWIPKHKQHKVVTKSNNYGSGLVDLLVKSKREGIKGMNPGTREINVDPYTFIEQGSINSLEVIFVPEQRDENDEIIVEKHLKYGSAVLPKPDADPIVDPLQGGGSSTVTQSTGTGQLPTAPSNYTPSDAAKQAVAGMKTALNAGSRKASANSLMAILNANPNFPDQAARDAEFEKLTGMTYKDAIK